jgi:hypothetical protein
MFTQEWLAGINGANCIESFITVYRAIEVSGKTYYRILWEEIVMPMFLHMLRQTRNAKS